MPKSRVLSWTSPLLGVAEPHAPNIEHVILTISGNMFKFSIVFVRAFVSHFGIAPDAHLRTTITKGYGARVSVADVVKLKTKRA